MAEREYMEGMHFSTTMGQDVYDVTVNMSGTGQDYSGDYNVKKFGAIGDGITDDTVAIQLTFDAASSAESPTVLFPAGTYIHSSIFTFDIKSFSRIPFC